MSDTAPADDALRIDQICDRFEAEWRAGRRPELSTYLGEIAPAQRAALLNELLAVEVEYRLRRGERPTLAEYQERFPDHAAEVRAVFTKPAPPQVGAAPPAEAGPTRLTFTATEGPHKGQAFTFAGHDIFLAGRSKTAHLRVTDGYFSRFHFMVEVNPPACRLTDLGSRNGTCVNGQRVSTADLRDGDVIKAGHTELRVSIPVNVAEATETPDDDAIAGARTLTLSLGAPSPEVPHNQEAPTASAAPRPTDDLGSFPTLPPTGPAVARPTDVAFPAVAGYDIVRELGRGGMGMVFLAVRQADSARVALKMIIPAVAGNKNQVERFLREAGILRKLQHRHIVSFRDMGETQGRLFFAMDYVEGTDGARLLKDKGPLPVRMAVRILCQVLVALEYAHGKGFVHRDIKPANILVTDEAGKKVVKLADFGLARVYQDSKLSGLTMHGAGGGTLAFMPPEQVTNFRQAKPAADQYSAAAMLYNLLTGRYVFDFQSAPERAVALVLQEEPVPIQRQRAEVPAKLAAAIHRALAKDPKDRFPNVRAFRAALKPFAE
jgi:serine/threonine-protein kinase